MNTNGDLGVNEKDYCISQWLYHGVSLARFHHHLLHCENSTAPRLSTKELGVASLDRKKDRSRSKSPFRSFRWKKGSKSPTTGAGAHSDDEANLERAAGEVLGRRRK
jgi:hypothetical protein